MSSAVQHIIVAVILAASAVWIVRRICHTLQHKESASSCNCDSCPLANCHGQKNITCEHKKVDKKIAHYNK